MALARAWIKRYLPGSRLLDSVTEETLSEIGGWTEVEWWLNETAGEPVFLRRDEGAR